MNQIICKTGIILGATIIQKGTVLSIPDEITSEDVQRLLASGEEIEEYVGANMDDTVNEKPAVEDPEKPLSMKEITAKLKDLGVKVPFGANKETLLQMLIEIAG